MVFCDVLFPLLNRYRYSQQNIFSYFTLCHNVWKFASATWFAINRATTTGNCVSIAMQLYVFTCVENFSISSSVWTLMTLGFLGYNLYERFQPMDIISFSLKLENNNIPRRKFTEMIGIFRCSEVKHFSASAIACSHRRKETVPVGPRPPPTVTGTRLSLSLVSGPKKMFSTAPLGANLMSIWITEPSKNLSHRL